MATAEQEHLTAFLEMMAAERGAAGFVISLEQGETSFEAKFRAGSGA